MSNLDLVVKLFLQLTVILAACRIVGILGRYLGQTQVVSEMIAGVLLGPSLFGIVAPAAQEWLFPQEAVFVAGSSTVSITHPSMTVLYALSQVGLVLYMFLIGLEFNGQLLKGRLRSAAVVSAAGIAVLFMGASMSITAFPMLARIIYENGIAGASRPPSEP